MMPSPNIKNTQNNNFKTLQQVGSLQLSDFVNSDMTNRIVKQNNRCHSIILTPFSAQELKLASAIAELMEIIAKYPNVPDSFLVGDSRKPSQLVVTKASVVVGAVKLLSASCISVISNRINALDDQDSLSGI